MKIHYTRWCGTRYYFPTAFPYTYVRGICQNAVDTLLEGRGPDTLVLYITKTKPRRRPAVRVAGDITNVWVQGQTPVKFTGGAFGVFLEDHFNQRAYVTVVAEDGTVLFPKEQA